MSPWWCVPCGPLLPCCSLSTALLFSRRCSLQTCPHTCSHRDVNISQTCLLPPERERPKRSPDRRLVHRTGLEPKWQLGFHADALNLVSENTHVRDAGWLPPVSCDNAKWAQAPPVFRFLLSNKFCYLNFAGFGIVSPTQVATQA